MKSGLHLKKGQSLNKIILLTDGNGCDFDLNYEYKMIEC